jgi:hypothetical protein
VQGHITQLLSITFKNEKDANSVLISSGRWRSSPPDLGNITHSFLNTPSGVQVALLLCFRFLLARLANIREIDYGLLTPLKNSSQDNLLISNKIIRKHVNQNDNNTHHGMESTWHTTWLFWYISRLTPFL